MAICKLGNSKQLLFFIEIKIKIEDSYQWRVDKNAYYKVLCLPMCDIRYYRTMVLKKQLFVRKNDFIFIKARCSVVLVVN